VFFNLFNEAEPFAAILIAHRTHVFFGGLVRPEGRNLRPKAESGRRVLGDQLGGLEECCKLRQQGLGGAPTANTFCTY